MASASAPMEVAGPSTGGQSAQPKRILVNVDKPETEIPEARRNQYTPDKALKAKVITAIIHAHTQLCGAFGLTDTQFHNLSITMQVTSILTTIHNILRQSANPQAKGKITEKVKDYRIHVGDDVKPIDKELAHKCVILVFKAYNLDYNEAPFPAPWIGTMGPFLNFMCLFKHRMDEVRTGVSRFQVGKTAAGDIQIADLSQYGLNATHHIHCEGATYPPVKRSAIAQSIGPLTQLIMLHQSRKAPTYSEKWKKACARSLAHIPNHGEIIEFIFTHDLTTIGPYMATIGDLLTITGARSAVKAFFPFSFYYSILGKDLQNGMREAPVSTSLGGPVAYTPRAIQNIGDVDHSGKGAFTFYHMLRDARFSMYMDTTPEKISQIVFHSCFGTHLEDQEILRYMTGWTFSNRKEIGNAFRGKGTTTNAVEFRPVPIIRYAKLSQALPTDKTAGGQQQIWNRVTVSGKRRSVLSEAFCSYYKKRKTQTGSMLTSGNLYATLSHYKSSVLASTIRDGYIDQGTVEWRSTENLDFDTPGDLVPSPGEVRPTLFLGGEPSVGDDMEEEV